MTGDHGHREERATALSDRTATASPRPRGSEAMGRGGRTSREREAAADSLPRTAWQGRSRIAPATQSPANRASRLHPTVGLLIVSLFLPWTVGVDSFVLSPYRLVLLAAIGPCLWMWSTGRAGRIRLPDLALLAYATCCLVSLSVNHGIEVGLKSGGVQVVETLGGYFIARCLIRSAEAFRRACRMLFCMVMILLPFLCTGGGMICATVVLDLTMLNVEALGSSFGNS